MCELLVAHPQFNSMPNMVNLFVPYLNSRDDSDGSADHVPGRQEGRDIPRIGRMVKSRDFNCHPDVIDCMLALRLSYVPR